MRATKASSSRSSNPHDVLELYDLDGDPNEVENLVGVRSGDSRDPRARELQQELAEKLREQMEECGTTAG